MYKRILHPTDLCENHYELCKQAADIAKYFGATLFLMHVIEPPTSLQIAQGLGMAVFDRPVKENAELVLKVLSEAVDVPVDRQFVEIGSIKQQVLDKANQLDCDLIIMGSHNPTQYPSFLGSTAHAVLNHADCDVLTVRVRD